MQNKIVIIVLAVILLIGGGYYLKSSNGTNKNQEIASDGHTDHSHVATTTESHMGDADEHAVQELGAKLAGTRVVLKDTSLKSGTQNIIFQIFGKDGHPFGANDLKITHEKKIHFIVVSDDFKEYLHLHPEFSNDAWSVEATLKDNMAYQAYVDISPEEESPQVLRVPLTIGSVQNKTKVSQLNPTFTVGKITASMKPEAKLVSGHENNIVFNLNRGGKSIVPEMYLGALGHVIALSHVDQNNFIHAHPDTHEGGDSDIHFAIDFPSAGTYTFFAQFQVDGQVNTYPFTVTVEDGHNEVNGHASTTNMMPAQSVHTEH
jgi:hypothetical protein